MRVHVAPLMVWLNLSSYKDVVDGSRQAAANIKPRRRLPGASSSPALPEGVKLDRCPQVIQAKNETLLEEEMTQCVLFFYAEIFRQTRHLTLSSS